MLSVLDLAKKIKGNCCEKLVKYTGQEYVISGGNVGVGKGRCLTIERPAEKSRSSISKLKVKAVLAEVMKYQGTNEAQMQDARKTLKT